MMGEQAYWSLRIHRGLVTPVENDGGGGSGVRIITVGASTFFVALNLISIRPCRQVSSNFTAPCIARVFHWDSGRENLNKDCGNSVL